MFSARRISTNVCIAFSVIAFGLVSWDAEAARSKNNGKYGVKDNAGNLDPNNRRKHGGVRYPDRSREFAARQARQSAISGHTPGSAGKIKWSESTFESVTGDGANKPILLYIYNPEMADANKAISYDMETKTFSHKDVIKALKGWECIKAESPVEGLKGDGRTTGAKLLLLTCDGQVWRRFTSAPPAPSFPGQLEFVDRQNKRMIKEMTLDDPNVKLAGEEEKEEEKKDEKKDEKKKKVDEKKDKRKAKKDNNKKAKKDKK